MAALRIAIVGDFDRDKRSHWATEAAWILRGHPVPAAALVFVSAAPSIIEGFLRACSGEREH
jgi:hypothetical protein